jgi:hypothetical protein
MTPHPILIAWHSRTGASEALANAVHQGAGSAAKLLPAELVQPEDILEARIYVFVCPENLASMSGQMKEMFDRCYYPVLGRIEGRAYATVIAAGSDGEGAQRQIDRISTGWRLRRVADHIIFNFDAQSKQAILAKKHVTDKRLNKCEELGCMLKEGLEIGIF